MVLIIIFVAGEPLPAYKDPGRLLLLRVWAAGPVQRPRQERRRDGARHDRRHRVSAGSETFFLRMVGSGIKFSRTRLRINRKKTVQFSHFYT
jgi:hypothetical protein